MIACDRHNVIVVTGCFDDIFDQILDVLRRQGRVSDWALKRQFDPQVEGNDPGKRHPAALCYFSPRFARRLARSRR